MHTPSRCESSGRVLTCGKLPLGPWSLPDPCAGIKTSGTCDPVSDACAGLPHLTPWDPRSAAFLTGDMCLDRARRSGGIQGGLSNGELIVAKIAFKPTSTISRKQKTVRAVAAPGGCMCWPGHSPHRKLAISAASSREWHAA